MAVQLHADGAASAAQAGADGASVLFLGVTVVASQGVRQVREWPLRLRPGTTVAQALERCGLDAQAAGHACAIWGRRVGLDQLVQEGDRLEWCRPLRVDPKYARRERFQAQGARTAGLFAKKTAPGAEKKPAGLPPAKPPPADLSGTA